MPMKPWVLAAVVEMQVAVDNRDHVVDLDAEPKQALVQIGSFRLVQVVDHSASVSDRCRQNGSVGMTDRFSGVFRTVPTHPSAESRFGLWSTG